MTDQMIEALKELHESIGSCVYKDNYNRAETKVMKELQKEGMVELAWITTPKGEQYLRTQCSN